MYDRLFRHLLFPVFDGVVKGRRTLDHLRNLERTQWNSRQDIEQCQLESLRQILVHAHDTSSYYQTAWNNAGVDPRQLRSLDDFTAWPLLTREQMRRGRAGIRSSLQYDLIFKSTGGSSGQPLQFDLDTGSNDRRVAAALRGYGWAGAGLGTRQLHLWGRSLGNVPTWKRAKERLHSRIENKLVISCFDFGPERMRQALAKADRFRADVIVAYTNPLYEWARFLEREQLPVRSPKSIIVGAEKIYPFQREVIERVFGAPVFETYGCREFMLIGAECPEHRGLHLTMEHLLVEITDDDGRPTPDGEEGNVVVTDLFNYGFPFIRYVTGDRAMAGFHDCPCGRGLPLLSQVVGRRLDLIETPSGRRIPGEVFPHLMKDYPGINRFQVVQRASDRVTVHLVPESHFTQQDRQSLEAQLAALLGPDMPFDLALVDDIPLTAAGKLKVVVREFDAEHKAVDAAEPVSV